MRSGYILGGILALALAGAPAALGQDSDAPKPAGESDAADSQRGIDPVPVREPMTIKLRPRGVHANQVQVGTGFRAIGKVFPWVPDQTVRVKLTRNKKVVFRRKVAITRVPGRNSGRFEIGSKRLIKPGTYRFRAKKHRTLTHTGASASTRGIGIDYPDLDPGNRNKRVRLFNKLLDKQAYYTSNGRKYGSATARAVLAFRKVNNMARTTNATPGIFKKLAAGRGGFKLKWPGGGKHIEADLSRQVMVLARGGRARHIFHVSSGAPATPTIRGKFPTYRKDPGKNSLGMIDSVYFIRGYATHGYHSVPTYPASHGCLRNPPANARFIYNWIDIGDVFYVYG